MKNLIREIRMEKGLTQDELSESLEVSRQTVISLEKGRYNPSLILAFKIAKLFNRTIEEIFDPEEME
ncbi:helix-turn-helix transcriptional regulator [Sporosarcina gallistercoris]|uniref:helix-turn-helix transcriptional regulator n=1 Tax=Sporosarcina gallistercoris TaxID=2762245 RepID=UPI003D27875C